MESELKVAVPDLGPFEQMVMTAILMLGNGTYGVPVYDKLTEMSGSRVNQGSFYTTLDRLIQKGYLSSRTSDPSKELRGRPKNLLSITPEGLRALERTVENAVKLTELFAQHSGRKKWKDLLLRLIGGTA